MGTGACVLTPPCLHVTSPADARGLVEADWLITGAGRVLHHAHLTDGQAVDVLDVGGLGPVVLSCGQTAGWVRLPGLFERASVRRCSGCCRARGLPAGVGSPKNDDDCRRVLGLDGPAPRPVTTIKTTGGAL